MTLGLDVTNPVSIDEAVEEVLRRFGRIDVLVHNAGYAIRAETHVEHILAKLDFRTRAQIGGWVAEAERSRAAA
jgi:NAD(P)-dependent dehydrogenase (short-subunit alcohol dehydrogenase family)